MTSVWRISLAGSFKAGTEVKFIGCQVLLIGDTTCNIFSFVYPAGSPSLVLTEGGCVCCVGCHKSLLPSFYHNHRRSVR
jgi:hypothetical protein